MLAGDTVMVPHEAFSDTPAYLALPRLRRRFRCAAREAAGLAELFLALDAGPDVVAHYEAEARRRPVDLLIGELVHLVARLALAEEVAGGDALDEAERLGDASQQVVVERSILTDTLRGPRHPVAGPGGPTLLWGGVRKGDTESHGQPLLRP